MFRRVIAAGAKYGNISFAEEWCEAMEFYRMQPDLAPFKGLKRWDKGRWANPSLVTLRVQVPNNHILTQNLY